jgi:hypothetical protein
MKNCFVLLVGTTLLLAGGAARAEEPPATFPGIEKLMSAEEFQASGMEKLTPAEREALDRWLIRYTAEESQVLFHTDEEVIKAVEEQETRSAVVSEFKGWSGDTLFELANGQVWQQRGRGRYAYHGPSPEVVITRNFMGFYRMELVENGKAVLVKRVK